MRLVVVVAALAGVASSSPARACEPLDCEPQIIVPSPARWNDFPGNAVNFKTGGGFGHVQSVAPRILDATGTPVAASAKRPSASGVPTVFSPDATLAPGLYQLEYDSRCLPTFGAWPLAAPGPRGVLPFRVSGPEPVPTNAGSLAVIERGTFDDFDDGTFVRLALVPTSEMLAYMSSTTWSLTVDGEAFWSPRDSGSDPTVVTLDCIPARVAPFSQDSCGYRSDVGPGPHHVVLTPHLTGVDVQPPPVALTVDVSCGAPAGDGGVMPGDGAAPTGDDAAPAPIWNGAAPPTSGGCSVGGRAARTRGWPLAAFALLAGLARRRRASSV